MHLEKCHTDQMHRVPDMSHTVYNLCRDSAQNHISAGTYNADSWAGWESFLWQINTSRHTMMALHWNKFKAGRINQTHAHSSDKIMRFITIILHFLCCCGRCAFVTLHTHRALTMTNDYETDPNQSLQNQILLWLNIIFRLGGTIAAKKKEAEANENVSA